MQKEETNTGRKAGSEPITEKNYSLGRKKGENSQGRVSEPSR